MWEGAGCTHPCWVSHTVSPNRALPPAGAVPKGCHWSPMLSLSQGPVLPLIWVDEGPWGQLSASPCPVPRAESISHGHAHPPPRAKGLCTQSPTTPKAALSPLWLLPAEEGGGCPAPNQLLFAGALWVMGLHRPGGSHCPHGGLGTGCVQGSALQTPTDEQQGGNPLHWEHHPEAWIFSSLWRQLSAPGTDPGYFGMAAKAPTDVM